jgi:hypothetical protein
MNQHLDIFPTVRAAITGQPRLPGPIFPSAQMTAFISSSSGPHARNARAW